MKFKCKICDDIFESEVELKKCRSCGATKLKEINYVLRKKNNFEA